MFRPESCSLSQCVFPLWSCTLTRWEAEFGGHPLNLIRPALCYRQRPTTRCGPSPRRSLRLRPKMRACAMSSPCSAWPRTAPSSRMRSLTTCRPRIMLRSGEPSGWKADRTQLKSKIRLFPASKVLCGRKIHTSKAVKTLKRREKALYFTLPHLQTVGLLIVEF